MKPEDFKRLEERFKRYGKGQITDKELEKRLMRQRPIVSLFYVFGLVAGLAAALNWPGPWFLPPFSSYLGWGILVLLAISLIKDWSRKEGAFFKRE